MKNVLFFRLLIMSLVFSCAMPSEAGFGRIEDIVSSFQAGKEPGYIKELMNQFSGNLYRFAFAQEIFPRLDSAKGKMALLVTMAAMVGIAENASWSACGDADLDLGVFAIDIASRAAKNAVLNSGSSRASIRVSSILNSLNIAESVVWNESEEVAPALINIPGFRALLRNANFNELEKSQMSFRAAEWMVLNSYLTHADGLIPSVFNAAFGALVDVDFSRSPFDSEIQWRDFQRTHFGDLELDSLVFLAPWLDLITLKMRLGSKSRLNFIQSRELGL